MYTPLFISFKFDFNNDKRNKLIPITHTHKRNKSSLLNNKRHKLN